MGQPGVRPRSVLTCLLLSSVRHFISCFSFYLLFPLSINPCSFGLYLSTTVKGLQRARFKSILQREPIKYMQMAWGGGWSDWGHESAWNFHVEHGSRDTTAPPLPPQQSVRAPRPAGAASCPAWGPLRSGQGVSSSHLAHWKTRHQLSELQLLRGPQIGEAAIQDLWTPVRRPDWTDTTEPGRSPGQELGRPCLSVWLHAGRSCSLKSGPVRRRASLSTVIDSGVGLDLEPLFSGGGDPAGGR